MSNSALTGVDTMNNINNTKLQDFVTAAAARGRITFGDVRRVQRDYLPGGITTSDEAEMLIGLDRVVIRADRAWKGWLVVVLRDFRARRDLPIAVGAGAGINRDVEPPAAPVLQPGPAPRAIAFPVNQARVPGAIPADIPAWAVLPVGTWSGINRLAMAA